MHKMSFLDKERSKNVVDSLAKALSSRDNSNINTGTVNAPQIVQSNNSDKSVLDGAGGLLTGGSNLYKGLKDSGLLDKFKGNSPGIMEGEAELAFGNKPISKSINDFVFDKPDFGAIGNATNNYVTGANSSNGLIGDSINSSIMGAGGSGFSMPGGGWLGLGTGLLNGLNKGLNHDEDKEIMGGIGNGIQGFFWCE